MGASKNDVERVSEILGDWDWAGSHEVEIIEATDDHRYIIGLDPGGTTGVAILRINPEDPKELPALVYLDQVEDGLHGFTDYFEDFTIGDNADLVSEQWNERNIKGVDRTPIYIEGAMHAMYGDYNVNWQDPEQKELIGDEFLKEQNLWVEGKRHAMDALIHTLVYLRNEEHPGTLSALGEGEQTIAQPGEAEGKVGEGESPSSEDGAQRDLAQFAREVTNEEEPNQNGSTEGDGVHRSEEDQAEGFEKTEVKGKRKNREVGGGFAGFISAEETNGEEEVSLLDD